MTTDSGRKDYDISLPPSDQRCYHSSKPFLSTTRLGHQQTAHALHTFWNRLSSLARLTMQAQSQSPNKWIRRGIGTVSLVTEHSRCVVVHEQGRWHGQDRQEVLFHNILRWTRNDRTESVRLEHLRRGADQPVLLLHLVLCSADTLSSVDPYRCGDDLYFGKVQFNHQHLRLYWQVIGKSKHESIDYLYS